MADEELRLLEWVGSSRKDLHDMPKRVRSTVGQALWDAIAGDRHPSVKTLQGFGGARVLEILESDDGKTYRAVYTVKFAGIVYVLHAFQKVSVSGVKTPAKEMELVRARLKKAEEMYAEWITNQKID